MLLNKRYDKEMAEEVIEQLENAFKQLVDEGTLLFRESKLKEYRTADGRLTKDTTNCFLSYDRCKKTTGTLMPSSKRPLTS